MRLISIKQHARSSISKRCQFFEPLPIVGKTSIARGDFALEPTDQKSTARWAFAPPLRSKVRSRVELSVTISFR